MNPKIPGVKQVEHGERRDPAKTPVYYFNPDGLPIWEEHTVPKEYIGKTPPDMTAEQWRAKVNDKYQELRQREYAKLCKSCERKLARKRKLEEEQRRENEEKLKRQKMEKEIDSAAEERLKTYFQSEFEDMDINITDDECEQDLNTQNKQNNGTSGDYIDAMKREKNSQDERSPMGCDVSDDSSEKSYSSNTLVNRRKSERIKYKSSTTPSKNMSAADVKMLSDLQLLKSILTFQGIAHEDPGDEDFLKNPRLIKALRGLQPADDEIQENTDSFQFSLDPTNTSTPISHIGIKIEGRPRKRRLANQEEFNYVFKNKVKKPNKISKSSSVVMSLGSPKKGKLLLKDKMPEDLIQQQTARVQQMAKVNTLLKKNPPRAKASLDNLFHQVGTFPYTYCDAK